MVAHDAILRGALSAKNASALKPSILEMKDQSFIKKLLNELGRDGGRSLAGHMAPGKRANQGNIVSSFKDSSAMRKDISQYRPQAMQLFQPIHRVFHPVVVEACCSRPGEPRLDPDRILAAGIVVRKIGKNNKLYGWLTSNGTILGWKRIQWGLGPGYGDDPDPKIRKKARLGANKKLLEKLEDRGSINSAHTFQETFTSLFKADPEICKKNGKTYLYGIAPLTSTERPEVDPYSDRQTIKTVEEKHFKNSDIRSMVPELLKPGNTLHEKLPTYIRFGSATNKTDPGIKAFMALIEFFLARVGLFTGESYVKNLKKAFGKTMVRARQKQGSSWVSKEISFYRFLEDAAALLVDNRAKKGVDRIYMPEKWPEIRAEKKVKGAKHVLWKATGQRGRKKLNAVLYEGEIISGIQGAFKGRWEKLSRVETRYDDASALYVISCFIRIKGACNCPPKTVWTAPSDPFSIAPWYASSDCPPVQIELPPIDPDRPEQLAGLAPGVAFKVPPKLQQVMEKMDLDSLMDGKKEKGSLGIGMICGFNIPIITLCAFIVLQIFLKLLNIVFWWLPFIKICIPYPKPSGQSKWP